MRRGKTAVFSSTSDSDRKEETYNKIEGGIGGTLESPSENVNKKKNKSRRWPGPFAGGHSTDLGKNTRIEKHTLALRPDGSTHAGGSALPRSDSREEIETEEKP